MAESKIMRFESPEENGKVYELHHITEAGAVLYNEQVHDEDGNATGINLTTVQEVLDRGTVRVQKEEPTVNCVWAKPVEDTVGKETPTE